MAGLNLCCFFCKALDTSRVAELRTAIFSSRSHSFAEITVKRVGR